MDLTMILASSRLPAEKPDAKAAEDAFYEAHGHIQVWTRIANAVQSAIMAVGTPPSGRRLRAIDGGKQGLESRGTA